MQAAVVQSVVAGRQNLRFRAVFDYNRGTRGLRRGTSSVDILSGVLSAGLTSDEGMCIAWIVFGQNPCSVLQSSYFMSAFDCVLILHRLCGYLFSLELCYVHAQQLSSVAFRLCTCLVCFREHAT